ncbi:PIG-L deacetylase family protein [Nitratireductor sp. GCM10026969]|uniref:PIG-L deacetylase family protein n=1 Tax=Nitratireductor sp. GCM10026969 TaxID=3252645 RepID=UPI00361F84CE
MKLDAGRKRPAGCRFLDRLGNSVDAIIDGGGIMAVFAHPDDETIAIGGHLPRLPGIRLLHVTDGAPAGMADALANGFSRREDYAAARKRELAAAVAMAGIPAEALLPLCAADQTVAFQMPALTRSLAGTFHGSQTRTVITHAYEGGHPDHDATALIVHAACRLLEERGAAVPEIVECPLYHSRDGNWTAQDFALRPHPGGREIRIVLTPERAQGKHRMLSAHASQHRTLARFTCAVECFRPAPRYDFAALPNGGELLYECFDWGLDGNTWLRLAEEARRELGLPRWF